MKKRDKIITDKKVFYDISTYSANERSILALLSLIGPLEIRDVEITSLVAHIKSFMAKTKVYDKTHIEIIIRGILTIVFGVCEEEIKNQGDI